MLSMPAVCPCPATSDVSCVVSLGDAVGAHGKHCIAWTQSNCAPKAFKLTLKPHGFQPLTKQQPINQKANPKFIFLDRDKLINYFPPRFIQINDGVGRRDNLLYINDQACG